MNRSTLYPLFICVALASACLTVSDTVVAWDEPERKFAKLVRADTDDDTLWMRLDTTQDGWLDGKELEGGWIRFDKDGDLCAGSISCPSI